MDEISAAFGRTRFGIIRRGGGSGPPQLSRDVFSLKRLRQFAGKLYDTNRKLN